MALVILSLWMAILPWNARHNQTDLDIVERAIKGILLQRKYDPSLIKYVVPINSIVEVAVAEENTDIIKEVFEVILIPRDEWYQGEKGYGGPLHFFYQTAVSAYASAAFYRRNDKEQAKWAMERGLHYLEALRKYDQDEAEYLQGTYEGLANYLNEFYSFETTLFVRHDQVYFVFCLIVSSHRVRN